MTPRHNDICQPELCDMPEELHQRWGKAPERLVDIVHQWTRKRLTTEEQYDLFAQEVADFERSKSPRYTSGGRTFQEHARYGLAEALAMYCDWMETTLDQLPLPEWARAPKRSGFVVPPTDSRGRNGWFPIGQPSTFIGFSGTGKTKLVLQMLDAMRTGEKFLADRHIPQKSVLWIQQDRGLEQLFDSYEDLFDSREPWFPYVPPIKETNAEAIKRIGELLAEYDYPEVCVVDGLDIFFSDLRGHAVKDLFPRLQRVTARCSCALVGTWGSPKRQATKDSYTEVRLAASGASEIGRLSATAALVTRDKDDDRSRKFTVATRRSNDDVYSLMFREDGWLIPSDPIALAKMKAGGSTDLVTNLKALGLDWKDVDGKLKGVSRATWFRKGRT
jgi:hypothetical protein